MLNAEILVVTDGISKINKFLMMEKLGDIKLNVLKIGGDLIEGSTYDLKELMDKNRIDFNPEKVSFSDIQKKMSDRDSDESKLSMNERRAYRFLLDYSDSIFADLKDICRRFIEIPDLDKTKLFALTEETLDYIENSSDMFLRMDTAGVNADDLATIYKKAYFLNEYIDFLMEYGGNKSNPILLKSRDKLMSFRKKLLENPDVHLIITKAGAFDEDKKLMKLSRKEMRRQMKEMQFQQKNLKSSDIKKAQIMLTMDVGEGSMGQLFMLLFIKLMELFKKIFRWVFRLK